MDKVSFLWRGSWKIFISDTLKMPSLEGPRKLSTAKAKVYTFVAQELKDRV